MTNSILTPDWPLPENVEAFYTRRGGGYSGKPYDSLNLAKHVGDNKQHVSENRWLLPLAENTVWLEQVHSNRCVSITKDDLTALESFKADASFTRLKQTVCAVLTADCLPILFCSLDGQWIGAIHAGWRGLASDIIQNTLKFLPVPADSLTVWIGPHISHANFQVGSEVKAAFADYDFAFTASEEAGKYQCSMLKIASAILQQLGVTQIHSSPDCTYGASERYFSHRKATNQGYAHTGRMACGIFLR